MIIVRSPLRISLGGGGTDLPSYYKEHEGFLVSSAIYKYVYITLHETFEDQMIIKYSKLEKVKKISEIEHPIIREALNLLNYSELSLEISSMADIPSGTGLGSSGSFTTALLMALHTYKKNNLPYIVILTDPTAGGITASYAMLGDIHIAEPGALIAFAGARVIQGTVKEELPEGFQKSEYVEKTGFVDVIIERKDLSEKIGTLLSILLKKNSVINSEENETSENSQSLTKAAS